MARRDYTDVDNKIVDAISRNTHYAYILNEVREFIEPFCHDDAGRYKSKRSVHEILDGRLQALKKQKRIYRGHSGWMKGSPPSE
jgi:hypothetical protein